jgi:hypothetical protein
MKKPILLVLAYHGKLGSTGQPMDSIFGGGASSGKSGRFSFSPKVSHIGTAQRPFAASGR